MIHMRDQKNKCPECGYGKCGRAAVPVVMLIAIFMVFGVVGYLEQTPVPVAPAVAVVAPPAPLPPVFAKMTSHVPEQTIKAIVQHSKRPKTLTAIAAVETGKAGTVHTRGDAGQSKGIFQIQKKHWFDPGDTVVQQVLSADRILDELIADTGSLHSAIKAYNGTGKQAELYRRKVYAKLEVMR